MKIHFIEKKERPVRASEIPVGSFFGPFTHSGGSIFMRIDYTEDISIDYKRAFGNSTITALNVSAGKVVIFNGNHPVYEYEAELNVGVK